MYQGKHSRAATLAEQRRRRRQRRGALLASLSLIGALAVGGTIAYLMQGTEDVVNTFEPTEVTCAISEVNSGEQKANVRVVNTGDVDAYVRAAVVVNWMDEKGNVSGVPVKDSDYEMTVGTGWTEGADGFYYYASPVAPKALTSPLIKTCTQAEGATAPSGNYSLSVEILASAIQADGADSKGNRPVELAWGVDIDGGEVKAATIAK